MDLKDKLVNSFAGAVEKTLASMDSFVRGARGKFTELR